MSYETKPLAERSRRTPRKASSSVQALLALTASFAAGMGLTANPALATESTIVALGDSNTSGYGVGEQNAFPARLEQMLRQRGRAVHVVNAGVPGDTFGGMLNRVDSSVPGNARLVIVQGGYNDRASGVPPERTIADLRGILSKLRGRHIAAVVCGFFDKKWDAIGRNLAATYSDRFVPGSTCYDPRHRGPDGLHMSAAGHEVVAARLAQAVGPSGAKHPALRR